MLSMLDIPMVVYVALLIVSAVVVGRVATIVADQFRRPEERSQVMPHGRRLHSSMR